MNAIIILNSIILNFFSETFVHMLEQKNKRERDLLKALVTLKMVSRIVGVSPKIVYSVKKRMSVHKAIKRKSGS